MRPIALLALSILLPSCTLGQTPVLKQKFVCNTGYTLQQCDLQMSLLRPILTKFHGDDLQEWTWILVRSDDWRSLLNSLGADHDSPSLTFLQKKTTLFEEALVEPIPSRRAELLKTWQMPLNRLLVEAVTHELGHALCQDPDEGRAERRARLLQQGEKPACENRRPEHFRAQFAAVLQPSASFSPTPLRVKPNKRAGANSDGQ